MMSCEQSAELINAVCQRGADSFALIGSRGFEAGILICIHEIVLPSSATERLCKVCDNSLVFGTKKFTICLAVQTEIVFSMSCFFFNIFTFTTNCFPKFPKQITPFRVRFLKKLQT